MPSIETPPLSERTFAGALVLATGLQIAESLIPRIPLFPWLRLGLSWAVLLPFLLSFGVRPAILLFLARNVLSLTFGGQPPSTFLISSISGVLSIALAGGSIRRATLHGWMGWIGASVLLAACFNVLQLGAVTALLVGHSGNLFQLGPILAWSILSGSLVAWLARSFWTPMFWNRVDEAIRFHSSTLTSFTEDKFRPANLVVWSVMAILPFTLSDWRHQIVLAGLLGAQALVRRGVRGFRILWHSWPYFAFLAWLHLFDTPGHFLSGTIITSEGLHSFVLHASRLGSFLIASQEVIRWIPWRKIAPSSLWARGMGLALPLLPNLFPTATRAARIWWKHRGDPQQPNLVETILRELVPEKPT